MKMSKSEAIAELESRGAHWCAERLYSFRSGRAYDAMCAQIKKKYEERLQVVMMANENLAHILSENGVRPSLLRVHYIDRPCESCMDECYWNECTKGADVVETLLFYNYRIESGTLEGVDADFISRQLACTKVVDERTGEVLYEEKEEE